jgi:conjugative relaxase-like TrwC/TraI family protein
MLRIIQNSTAEGAKSYYSTSDYYIEGQEQELAGEWRGKGAARLGLAGTIERKEWDALCDNRDPNTGKTLTARQKSNRRIGYDINFHVPKSASLLYGLTRDERILNAFRESVDATMQDMESEMQTRVRKDGRDEDRTTGNMVWGAFVHFTARPVDGVPDPHLHAHCFAFNTTWDPEESRWKAGQFAGLKRDAPYFEAVFHSRLARRLEELGLPVLRTRKGWEIDGLHASTLRKFSRRTALIEGKAKERGVTDPAVKGELGAKTRERKRKNLSLDELRQDWRSRLTDDERDAIESVASNVGGEGTRDDERAAEGAVSLAIDHCFERKAVLPERELLTQALKRAYGRASLGTVTHALEKCHLLSAERDGRRLVTTRDVLGEERRMLDFARDGRGSCATLAATPHAFTRDWLNAGQRQAVLHVLHAHDRVILVRGAAGVGKTSMMQETAEAIERAGKRVFAFAPSADASRGVLRQEGFTSADTVARLLLDQRLQGQTRGQVLWIDEAGQLGTRTMAQLFDLARKLDARIVLSGDRRQHGSVERGAALRLLEEEAGLVPAEIKNIQRQKGDYKNAVHALSEGRTEAGFRQLDKLGWIKEVPDANRYALIARDYAATIAEGKTALVISPTHREGERITKEIRAELRKSGKVRKGERQFTVLTNANLTEAERRDPVNYLPGDAAVFHQNANGFTKSDRVLFGDGPLPLDQAERFQVFHRETLAVAPGDLVRITHGGMTADRLHRLNNGATYTVRGFDRSGNIVLANGWTVAKDFGHLAHAYCVTSHASQGKTVDRVIIGQSAISLPASSREQLYVSVSRGRERATIYSDDRNALLEAVSRADDRLTATELLEGRQRRQRRPTLRRISADHDARGTTPRREHEGLAHVR